MLSHRSAPIALCLRGCAPIAQLVERGAYIIWICESHRNAKVVGSRPTWSIFFLECLQEQDGLILSPVTMFELSPSAEVVCYENNTCLERR